MGRILTGVDKLLRLLEDKGKVSSVQAAAELNVDQDVLQEWVELLEHEGFVDVTYRFSKQFLEIKKQNVAKTAEKNINKVTAERDAFKRRIDSAIKDLNKETAGFDTLKKHYRQVQSDIKDELKTVRTQISELDRFEKLRSQEDKKIKEQKEDYEKFSKEYDKQIERYEAEYADLAAKVGIEEKKIDTLKKEIVDLKEQRDTTEKIIEKAVKDLKGVSESLSKKLSKLKDAEKSTDKIRKDLESIQYGVDKRKEEFLINMAKRIGTRREEIKAEHEELLRSTQERIKMIQSYTVSGREAYENFNDFFVKKIKTMDLFDDIEKEKKELQDDLLKLKKKVEAFGVLEKYAKVKKETGDIEKAMKDYTKRKEGLIAKIRKLLGFMGG